MSNPSATDRLRSSLLVAAVVLSLGARSARADTRQECSEAYDETQVLRDAGDIEAGLAEAEKCTRAVCAPFIRDDCAKWKADLEDRQSTVLVTIVDVAGRRVTDAVITLDGSPWLDHLDGAPHALSKGAHTLEITVDGAAPHKKSIVVREREKRRELSFSLGVNEDDDARHAFSLLDPDSPPRAKRSPSLVLPAVLTGVGGLALAATGAILLGMAANQADRITELCGDAPPACKGSAADRSAANDLSRSGKALEIAGGSFAAVGAAGVAVGVTLLLVDAGRRGPSPDGPPDPSKGALVPGAWLAPTEGGLWLRGTF
ncbi:MAG: hypothetical protein U0414_35465 [Polyangiaceae bacterium]